MHGSEIEWILCRWVRRHPYTAVPGREKTPRQGQVKLAPCRMSLLDLIKATIVCGGVAFLFYSFPVLGQIAAITLLSLLWLSYARKTVIRVRARRTV